MNLNDYDILSLNLHFLNFNTNNFNDIPISIIKTPISSDKTSNTDFLTKLNPNSFSKSNSSLMCSLIHFLLLSLDPSLQETLRLCFPVVTLSDLKLFKDTVYQIITQRLPQSIIPGRSVLDSAKGDRMVNFLRNFSDFVIKSKLPTNNQFEYVPELIGTGIKSDSEILLKMKKNMLITHISNIKEVIFEKTRQIHQIQEKWKNYANKLSNNIQKLERENVVLKNKSAAIMKKGAMKFSEISSIDRAPKIENHKEFINLLNQLYGKFVQEKEFKDNIGYISETNELYDMITPETLNKEKQKDSNMLIIHEEAKLLDKRIKEDNEKFKYANDKDEEIKNLTTQIIEKIDGLQEDLSKIYNELK